LLQGGQGNGQRNQDPERLATILSKDFASIADFAGDFVAAVATAGHADCERQQDRVGQDDEEQVETEQGLPHRVRAIESGAEAENSNQQTDDNRDSILGNDDLGAQKGELDRDEFSDLDHGEE